MKLGPIVLKLRLANTRFGNLIGGAVELGIAMNNTLSKDMAFVIPLAEDATENLMYSAIEQSLTERFAVVVAIANDSTQKDKLGIGAHDVLHDVRDDLFHELIGWDMGYDGQIYYRGGRVVDINAAYLWYQYEFEYKSRLVNDTDGFGHLQYTTVSERQLRSQLPDMDKFYVQYIMTPSTKWENLEYERLPVAAADIDMAQYISTSDIPNPDRGAYNFAFMTGFDFYKKK